MSWQDQAALPEEEGSSAKACNGGGGFDLFTLFFLKNNCAIFFTFVFLMHSWQ